ncbi:MAG TPA: hypothetical protein PKC24_10670 [Cyclobacteriaceae bacterium]|nr:hypothetical protein [Cyclobacteriaceae bacterium]
MEKVSACIKTFAADLRTRGFNAEAALLNKSFELKDNSLHFVLSSVLEEDLLSAFKIDLAQKLKENLKTSISIVTSIEQIDTKKMIYTNQEKYEYLLNKKPILKDFKDRLGLDTDF